MAIGVVFIAIAIAVLGASNGVLQISVKYSDTCASKIAPWNANASAEECVIEFETTGNDCNDDDA